MQSLILVQLLITKLQNLLHDDITDINSHLITTAINLLQSFQPSLRYALDYKSTNVHLSDCRMADLMSTLHFAEDAIDTFIARIKLEKDIPIRRTWRDMCTSKSKGSRHLVFLDQMKIFNERASAILNPDIAAGSSSESSFGKSVQQCWERISSSCLQEDAFDFLEPEQRKNLNWLCYGFRHQVTILAGGAGFGKTTLAKIAFNNPRAKTKFRLLRCWVCASEIYKFKDVMAEILKQVNANAEEPILESGILQMLETEVKQRDFRGLFVVIDDVRSRELVEIIQAGMLKFFKMFHDGLDRPIKVIITTRVRTADSDCIELSPLNEADSWALFSKKNPDADCSMKEQTFKLCRGIPLALSLLGSLYSIEKSDFYDLDHQQVFASSENVLASVSSLCYQRLSSSLKPCFLYMGLFPRGFEIPVRRLYRLWEAEGFLPEDEADKCFQELVSRNLIEIATWRSDGRPKTCHLQNTQHEIFSQKAKDIGFFQILPTSLSSNKTTDKVPRVAVRRLVAHHGIKKYPPLYIYEEHLRTYISFNTRKRGTPITKELDMFLKRNRKGSYFTLLKVLDLENIYKPRLPEEMGEVFPFLTYLGLRSTALTLLSESVGKLRWLKTLDVKHTFISSLPVSVFKLDHMIHLYLNWSNLHVPSGTELSFPSQLRTVWGLSLSRDNHNAVMKWLAKSTRIVKLGLQYLNLSVETQGEVIDWILRQSNLQSLKLRSTDETGGNPSILVLKRLADQLQNLTNLYLAGTLEPDVIRTEMFPSSLKFLTLSMSKLKEDPMLELGELPHLNILRLFGDFYMRERITCKSGGFPELRALKLWNPKGVDKWMIEEAALPCIRQIVIRNMHNNLLHGQVGTEKLKSLEELNLKSTAPVDWDLIIYEMESERKNFHGLVVPRSTSLKELLLDAEF